MILETNDEEQRGASYTRWGRKVCEGNATLVYKGIVYRQDCHYQRSRHWAYIYITFDIRASWPSALADLSKFCEFYREGSLATMSLYTVCIEILLKVA